MPSIEQISREVDADRARLAKTLDDLTDTVNPQRVTQEVTQTATDVGGDLAQKAWNTLREQPAGGLLVSIGLGLLAAGSQRRPAHLSASGPTATAVDPTIAMEGFDKRVAAADAEIRSETTGQVEPAPQASRLRATLKQGLDQLPPKARGRVVKAREAAISAQETMEAEARRAARKSKGFIQEQPLAAGALALGFGTLLGTLLPGTRREDALLGARRDTLMAQARHALEDEMEKAKDKAEKAFQKQGKQTTSDLGV